MAKRPFTDGQSRINAGMKSSAPEYHEGNQIGPTGKTTFKLPPELKGKLPNTHPYVNAHNHEKLLQHCIQRMQMARELRDQIIIRFRNIDLDFHGFVKLSDEDRNRMMKNRTGNGGQKPVDVMLPLAEAKIDEMLTFLLEVFWPNDGMHTADASASQQDVANAFAALLNKQANRRQHYRKLARFFLDALKYNYAAMVTE